MQVQGLLLWKSEECEVLAVDQTVDPHLILQRRCILQCRGQFDVTAVLSSCGPAFVLRLCCLPCFSASCVTGFRSLSRRCLNRLCSTSSCCSPATSIASILRSEQAQENKEREQERASESERVLQRVGHILSPASSSAGVSGATYRHTACEGRWHQCWFSVCLPVTCRRRAQGEPAGVEQLRRIPLTCPFALQSHFSHSNWSVCIQARPPQDHRNISVPFSHADRVKCLCAQCQDKKGVVRNDANWSNSQKILTILTEL